MSDQSHNLVELQKSYDYAEAQIIRGLLQSNGLFCEVFDASANSTLALYQYAMGGARIMVKEKDQAKALEILAEIEAQSQS